MSELKIRSSGPRGSTRIAAPFYHAACLAVAICLATSLIGQTKQAASARPPLAPGAYFGLKLPGETPEVFAPSIMSTPGRYVDRIAFSPDGTECYFTVFDSSWTNGRILFTRYENGAWAPQAQVTFVDGQQQFEPLFSRDGNQLYFVVKNSTGGRSDTDFWMVRRASREAAWGQPEPLPAPLNSPKNELNLAQTADGTFYFASNRDGGLWRHGSLPDGLQARPAFAGGKPGSAG
jgi:hypothetical protein